jgi:hypothetical protein
MAKTVEIHFHVGAMMGTEREARDFARQVNKYIREEQRVGGW